MNEPNMVIRNEYFRKRKAQFEAVEAQYAKARAELVTIGEQVIEPIIQEYCRHSSSTFEKNAVLVLKEIGTDKAREGLLNMAIGHGKFGSPNRWAARNYIQAVKNKADVRKLLVLDRSDILSDALLALKNEPIDEEFLKKLETLLESKYHSVRLSAAAVIGADPSSQYVKEKVSMIIKAIDKAEKWTDARQQFPSYLAYGSLADHTYFRMIEALSAIKGADTYLKQVSNETKGKTRWCVLMARAHRGDASVRNTLYEIISDPNAGLLRSSAVWSLAQIGTLDDLPFLQGLAKSDPFRVPGPQGSHTDPETGERPKEIYPVRLRAEQAIRLIEKKCSGKQVTDNSLTELEG